jgi:hypothetical protein
VETGHEVLGKFEAGGWATISFREASGDQVQYVVLGRVKNPHVYMEDPSEVLWPCVLPLHSPIHRTRAPTLENERRL